MKRVIAILALFAVVLAAGSCESSPDLEPGSSPLGAYSDRGQGQDTSPARDSFSMIFYEDMDTNPLTATNSENHELLKLVYSAPIRLDGSLKPQYVLAEKIEMEGTAVTIVFKKGLTFSDGSALTAADAAESIKVILRSPTSPYYSRLANVKSYKAAITSRTH